ncbi:WD40-repeat-containing domain protein [Curvularia clavata]|uniref:WD40-repeat-containing domain protein n=1 Tax=Curvularia clavata TaxID=95742 RepID=A0A9Q8ZC08_CURCL|nr:WD40-repeat-containing domain protein [Curvularia clavata]
MSISDRQAIKKKRCAKRTSQAGLDNTLGRLSRTEDAPSNAFAKQHGPTYLLNIRTVLLNKIYS